MSSNVIDVKYIVPTYVNFNLRFAIWKKSLHLLEPSGVVSIIKTPRHRIVSIKFWTLEIAVNANCNCTIHYNMAFNANDQSFAEILVSLVFANKSSRGDKSGWSRLIVLTICMCCWLEVILAIHNDDCTKLVLHEPDDCAFRHTNLWRI